MTMSTSERAEVNRRNTQRYCGHKSDAGKQRSSYNAIKHGMRARQPVLPGEDALARQARLDAWTDNLQPREDVERFLVGRAVSLSWQLDRAERARATRLADAAAGTNRLADLADEVITLGRRLFWDPLGPLPLYPHLGNKIGTQFVRFSWSYEIDDPNEPARIMNRLESTAIGCAWLLDRWGELRQRLEDGWTWQPPDRLKAIRMLGRQPRDAADDDRVMMIYLSCWAMAPNGPHGFADLVNELQPAELNLFIERLDDRQGLARRPASPEAGEAELRKIIAEEEERLEEVQEQHLERDETPDPALLFDGSEEGERLRRYEATCDRGLIRALAALRQRRRDAEAGASAGTPGGGKAASRPPKEDAVDRAAVLARILSSISGNGTATNEANGHEERGCPDPEPSAIEVLSDATNEAKAPAEVTASIETEVTPVAEPDGNGPRDVTNEANGVSGATDNGQRTTDNGRTLALALLVLLVFSGLAAAFAASAGVLLADSPRRGYDGDWQAARVQRLARPDLPGAIDIFERTAKQTATHVGSPGNVT